MAWPQSPSKKKGNQLVKCHDAMAEIFTQKLGLSVLDTLCPAPPSKAKKKKKTNDEPVDGWQESRTVDAFAAFLRERAS